MEAGQIIASSSIPKIGSFVEPDERTQPDDLPFQKVVL
jgi:hypothetical protein